MSSDFIHQFRGRLPPEVGAKVLEMAGAVHPKEDQAKLKHLTEALRREGPLPQVALPRAKYMQIENEIARGRPCAFFDFEKVSDAKRQACVIKFWRCMDEFVRLHGTSLDFDPHEFTLATTYGHFSYSAEEGSGEFELKGTLPQDQTRLAYFERQGKRVSQTAAYAASFHENFDGPQTERDGDDFTSTLVIEDAVLVKASAYDKKVQSPFLLCLLAGVEKAKLSFGQIHLRIDMAKRECILVSDE